MRKGFLVFLALVTTCYSCEKTGLGEKKSTAISNSSVQFTDTVKVPINDLGTGTYLGFKGGLYPNGLNTPSGKYARDLLQFATRITPLDSNGRASDSGKIVFISLGASTGGENMRALTAKTLNNPKTNPSLLLLSCNNGAGVASINSMMNPNDAYWDHVSLILASHHIGYKQVQVVYFETDDSLPINSFPGRAYTVRNHFRIAMQVCKAKFNHLKVVYVLGRTTTFDKILVQNIEPCPYYNGWGEKFFIEDQINGAPGTQYKGDSMVAPLVTWGWYQWADGSTIPRKDGFVWTKSLTIDGLHANSQGVDTLSTRFQNFLLTDKYASIWYANHTRPKGTQKTGP